MIEFKNKSLLGYCYRQKDYDQNLALTIKQKFDLDEIIAKLLASRKVSINEVENFLNPSIKSSLPNPFLLRDMEKAVNHAIEAIKNDKKITIFADYDVDGATSSALLKRFFAMINVEVDIYIPDRIAEGYGPNAEALIKLKNSGTDLVITVDCGAVAFEPLEKAHEAGLDIIVIDHHIGVTEMPKALAIINPNRIDETFEHKAICAATVSFLFAVALNKKLREIGFYGAQVAGGKKSSISRRGNSQQETKNQNLSPATKNLTTIDNSSSNYQQSDSSNPPPPLEPNLLNLLDLVALGTVCDVMPLTGLNRALVARGLDILCQRKNIGLKTLSDIANLDETPSAYHLGFVIGPRINAGGRVGKSDLGANLLSTNDEILAQNIASKLDDLNSERKDLENQALEEAILSLEKGKSKFGNFSAHDNIIFAVSDSWHQGIIGIVASRLKDKYNKPVAVITIENNKGKASCRSIENVDFGSAILNARSNNLLLEGGGHAMAGGFSIMADKIQELHKFFDDLMAQNVKIHLEQNIKNFDIELDLQNINLELLKSLKSLEPFGNKNPRPKFMVNNLIKTNAKLIGKTQEHISCNFTSLTNVGFDKNLSAVAFRVNNTIIGDILLDQKYKKPLKLIGDLNINQFMGQEKVQMIIEDIIL